MAETTTFVNAHLTKQINGLTRPDSVASAVAVFEDSSEQTTPTTNGTKRRQSEAPEEQTTKRQRTSPGKTPPSEAPKDEETERQRQEAQQPHTEANNGAPTAPSDTRDSRRKSGVTDEKQRSKRLFGALLGNLNQPGDRVSRRRTEIEQRRKAELQKQDDERLEDRQKRLEQLTAKRKREQINVDEQHMHIRHKNLLKAANFLQTRTEPRLYYKPWDLLADEEDRIDDQLKEAQDKIDDELADWEEEKQKRLDSLDAPEAPTQQDSGTKNGDAGTDNIETESAAPGPDTTHERPDTEAGDERPAHTNEPRLDEVPESPPRDQEEPDDTNGEPNEPTKTDVTLEDEKSKPHEEQKEDAEDDGDHVVEEGDEDTVIY